MTLNDYAAWFSTWGARLPAQDRPVASFVLQHADALARRVAGRGRARKGSEDELQDVMLGVVEAVREAQAAGVEMDGPLALAWVERALRQAGRGAARTRERGRAWNRRAREWSEEPVSREAA